MTPRRKISRGQAGQALVMIALALIPLIGMAGLAIDVGGLYVQRRMAQSTADLANAAGVQEISRGDAHTTFRNVVVAYASKNGFGGTGDTIITNNPPTSGSYAGNWSAYEVIIQRSVATTLMRAFGQTASTVVGRSVAIAQKSGSGIVVLDSTAKSAFVINGKSSVRLASGQVYVNSSANNALDIRDSSKLYTSAPGNVHGNYKLSSSGTLNPKPTTSSPQIADPLASLPVPSCSVPIRQPGPTTYQPADGETLCPGIYFGGLKIVSKQTVTMAPCGLPADQAVFIIGGGGVTVKNSTLIGNGVMIYNTSAVKNTCSATANIQCAKIVTDQSATFNLTPPGSGNYEGLTYFQDRNCTQDFDLSGAALAGIVGEIYSANGAVVINGSSKTPAVSVKTSFVVNTISFGSAIAASDDDVGLSISPTLGASSKRYIIAE